MVLEEKARSRLVPLILMTGLPCYLQQLQSVALPVQVGKNDGSVKGKSYFQCEPGCPPSMLSADAPSVFCCAIAVGSHVLNCSGQVWDLHKAAYCAEGQTVLLLAECSAVSAVAVAFIIRFVAYVVVFASPHPPEIRSWQCGGSGFSEDPNGLCSADAWSRNPALNSPCVQRPTSIQDTPVPNQTRPDSDFSALLRARAAQPSRTHARPQSPSLQPTLAVKRGKHRDLQSLIGIPSEPRAACVARSPRRLPKHRVRRWLLRKSALRNSVSRVLDFELSLAILSSTKH